MHGRYDTFSLKQLLLDLHREFPSLKAAHLFGSRLHRTRSTRSDVDILIEIGDEVRGEQVRDFALAHCPALDLFLLDGGTATSCANGSKVKGSSRRDLLRRLGSEKLWSSSGGFTNADVDWDFEVIKGRDPMMTTLVSASPYPSKSLNVSDNPAPEQPAPSPFGLHQVKQHPVIAAVLIAVATAAVVFGVVRELRIVPLKEDNERLLQRIEELQDSRSAPGEQIQSGSPLDSVSVE